ncbi:MAG: ComF family protein [Gemmatimonadaceae bacterium]|nr:ComF family protein [Gemmatimonadaceae bacterium]
MGLREGLSRRWRSALDGALKGAIGGALELAVPRTCLVCSAGMSSRDAGLVCGVCWSRLPLLPKPWCARCGHPKHAESNAEANPRGACPVCRLLEPRCSLARSVCWVPHAQSTPLLAALKYQGWWGMADGMAERMVRFGGELLDGMTAPCFVPVPLAAARLRERGFNQSAHLAGALAQRTGGTVLDDGLVRIRTTESQTQLTPAERRANVHHAFAVPAERQAVISGRELVLVDDVLTTGATLNACAVALLDGGASDIRYWTFGRARSDADRP